MSPALPKKNNLNEIWKSGVNKEGRAG